MGRKPIPEPETYCYCGAPSFIKSTGLCKPCYESDRRKRLKEAGTPVRHTPSYKPCSVCGLKGIIAKGMCSSCYQSDYYLRRVEREGPRQKWVGFKRSSKESAPRAAE